VGCFNPITLRRDKPDAQTVPCGRCDACLLSRSRDWSLRCVHELRYHTQSAFLTLTYRDDALVYGGNSRATLVKSHLQDFWKAYRHYLNRKEHGQSIRYFACGEYGSLRYRPHYHAIIFGHDFPDKEITTVTNDTPYYSSRLLNDLWGHGSCIIGNVNPQSCAYVARYTLKKAYGGDAKKWLRENLIEPEFLSMSLKPGIGAQFYTDYKSDMYPSDIMVMDNGGVVKPPRYYGKLLRRENPRLYETIMSERMSAIKANARDNSKTRRKAKALVQRAKLTLLKRNYED